MARGSQKLPRIVRGHETERSVGAAVQDRVRVERLELPVPRGAEPVLHSHRVAAAVRVEDFLARVQDLHRATGPHREERDAELEVEGLRLAAEGPSHGRLHDPHLRHVVVEHAREFALQVVRDLRGRPHLQHAIRVESRDRAVRLDRRVGRPVEVVLPFDRDVRRRHPRVHVPELEVDVLEDVAVRPRLARRVDGLRNGLGRQRLLGREIDGKRLVLDVDPLERRIRRVLVDRRHRRHRVADEAHLVDAERVLVAGPGDDPVRGRQVPSGDDTVHAIQRLGLARVDGDDSGVRLGGAEDLPVQQPRQDDVVRVDLASRRLAQPLDPARTTAQRRELACGHLRQPVRVLRGLKLRGRQFMRVHPCNVRRDPGVCPRAGSAGPAGGADPAGRSDRTRPFGVTLSCSRTPAGWTVLRHWREDSGTDALWRSPWIRDEDALHDERDRSPR